MSAGVNTTIPLALGLLLDTGPAAPPDASNVATTWPMILGLLGGATPTADGPAPDSAGIASSWPLILGLLGGGTPAAAGTSTAPSDVVVIATGGTTAYITITDNSGGAAAHRWQIRPAGGTWVDATGGTNMSFPGTVDFTVTDLTPASRYEVRVLAWIGGVESAWAYAADLFWTDNTGGGESDLEFASSRAAAGRGRNTERKRRREYLGEPDRNDSYVGPTKPALVALPSPAPKPPAAPVIAQALPEPAAPAVVEDRTATMGDVSIVLHEALQARQVAELALAAVMAAMDDMEAMQAAAVLLDS